MTPRFTWWPAVDRPGNGLTYEVPWERFEGLVAHARTAPSKDGLARLACVEFRRGYRSLGNVLRCHAVVLDVDDGTELGPLLVALADLYAIVHSTFSATETAPRWRIFAPLDRPVSAEEYPRAYRYVAELLERVGVRLDHRGPSQPWAVPARPPSGYYVSQVTTGAVVDVEAALVRFPPPEPIPEPARRPAGGDLAARLERASRYLATMPGALSGSGGHAATIKAALVLVRGFALPEADALRLLVEEFNPRCAPAWTVRDLRHKVRQAYQRGRLPFGFIIDRRAA